MDTYEKFRDKPIEDLLWNLPKVGFTDTPEFQSLQTIIQVRIAQATNEQLAQLRTVIDRATQEVRVGNERSGRLTETLVRLNTVLTWATVAIAVATIVGVGVAVFQAVKSN